ncbi:MAG: hypothetical protein IKJ50_04505 [Clostridia bacterium]|nr:hypothetical protein [Clostridia bacterium]
MVKEFLYQFIFATDKINMRHKEIRCWATDFITAVRMCDEFANIDEVTQIDMVRHPVVVSCCVIDVREVDRGRVWKRKATIQN